MEDKTPTMSDQGFIDAIGDKFKDLIGKLPTTVPGQPTPTPGPLPAWATYILGVVLTIALSFIAAKWGITPTPIPSLQSQPQVVVLQVPAATMAVETKSK